MTNTLIVDVVGYEGPIDLLLDLARTQKVDLRHVSILELVQQYLVFIEEAEVLKITLAGDYLVMAAWLVYLKSRLLLPVLQQEDGENEGTILAAFLAFRLRQLESMQNAARTLAARPRVFCRGQKEDIFFSPHTCLSATLYDLLSVYSAMKAREKEERYDLPAFNLMSIDEAIKRMTRLLYKTQDWQPLERFIPQDEGDILYTRSALAALLVAGLELTRQGVAQIRQEFPFSPVHMRRKK